MKQTTKPIQTQTQKMNALKKEVKAIDQKIVKLARVMETMVKDLVKLQKQVASSGAKRRVSYIDWLENERRIKDTF